VLYTTEGSLRGMRLAVMLSDPNNGQVKEDRENGRRNEGARPSSKGVVCGVLDKCENKRAVFHKNELFASIRTVVEGALESGHQRGRGESEICLDMMPTSAIEGGSGIA